MPIIEYQSSGAIVTLADGSAITISGINDGVSIGIADAVTGETAPVTTAGVYTRVNNPSKLGSLVIEAIDGTERVVDTTTLSGIYGYPMDIEIEARDADCYVQQGDASVALVAGGLGNPRILADRWRRVTVDSPDDAYFAIQQSDPTTSGLFVAMRIDSLT